MVQRSLSTNLSKNTALFHALLPLDDSFDLITRDLKLGNTPAYWIGVNGFCKTEILQQIFSDLQDPLYTLDSEIRDLPRYVQSKLGYAQVSLTSSIDTILQNILSGPSVLLVEGFAQAVIIDVRTYPVRSISEPDTERITRGARDGFVETLLFNTNLIRRRVRSPKLTFSICSLGAESRTDVAIAYLADQVNEELLDTLKKKLSQLQITSLTMGSKSLEELLIKKRWWNPLPSIQLTERPDVACSYLCEGHILLIVDNSPAAMILPTRFFDFVQEANDFYFPPLVGSYLRILRVVVFLLTLFITPVWYLLVQDPDLPNSALGFLAVTSEYEVPILAQLLLTEFIVDLLKLASLNTPSVFSNSFSMIGALVLGDFAVQAHWLVPEVLAYMAFVAIANFAQPSYELGYAFKLLRLVLLVSSAALGWVGLALGTLLIIVLLVTTRPIAGGHYMYPIYPFNWHALRALLIRRPIAPDNT